MKNYLQIFKPKRHRKYFFWMPLKITFSPEGFIIYGEPYEVEIYLN